MTMAEARADFLSYLEAERGCSPHTVSAYRRDLEQLIRHLGRQRHSLEVAEVHTSDIRGFVAALQARRLQASTIARRVNCLRSLFRFLCANGYVGENPCLTIGTPKKAGSLPTILTEAECRSLLEAAYRSHYTMLGFRDNAVLSTLVYTGLRRQELVDLTLDDIDLEQRSLRVRRGKGNKMRMVPLVPEVVSAIEDWLEFRPQRARRSLFATLTGKPLGRHGIQALFRKALRNAGITRRGISVHSCRHSFASLLLKSGCDLVSIKEILGHASLESTSVYLHLTSVGLKRAVSQHPLSAAGQQEDAPDDAAPLRGPRGTRRR